MQDPTHSLPTQVGQKLLSYAPKTNTGLPKLLIRAENEYGMCFW